MVTHIIDGDAGPVLRVVGDLDRDGPDPLEPVRVPRLEPGQDLAVEAV